MELIKELRLKKGLSLRALGIAIHKSPAFLSELERGTRKPSQETLASLASILGSGEELFLASGLVAPEVKKALADTKVYRFISKLSLLEKVDRDAFLQTANKLL
jgi:transcriptional regulator with XRE-family HTH domain